MTQWPKTLFLQLTDTIYLVITCVAPWLGSSETKRIDERCPIIQTLNTYPVGTSCNLTCYDQYYQISGNNLVTCLSSGKWDLEYIRCGGE